MFPYFPSNPLKGLIITNFFCYLKIFPTFLIFNISFTSRNLKLEQPRIHLKKVQSHKCWKVVAPHSPKNLQILRAAHILPHLFHDLRSKKSIFFSTSFCSINIIKTFPFVCWLCTWKILWRAVSYQPPSWSLVLDLCYGKTFGLGA